MWSKKAYTKMEKNWYIKFYLELLIYEKENKN